MLLLATRGLNCPRALSRDMHLARIYALNCHRHCETVSIHPPV